MRGPSGKSPSSVQPLYPTHLPRNTIPTANYNTSACMQTACLPVSYSWPTLSIDLRPFWLPSDSRLPASRRAFKPLYLVQLVPRGHGNLSSITSWLRRAGANPDIIEINTPDGQRCLFKERLLKKTTVELKINRLVDPAYWPILE